MSVSFHKMYSLTPQSYKNRGITTQKQDENKLHKTTYIQLCVKQLGIVQIVQFLTV